MNFHTKTIPNLLYLLILCTFFQSCRVEKIKEEFSPDENAYKLSDDYEFEGVCNFRVIGKVVDSKTCDPIEDAVVTLEGSNTTVFTDMHGDFLVDVDIDSDMESVYIFVNKDDYTQSQFLVGYHSFFEEGEDCDGRFNCFVFADFFLAPQQEKQTITHLWGEWWINDKVKSMIEYGEDCVTDFHINIPEFSVDDDIDIYFTPLDLRQYLCLIDHHEYDDDGGSHHDDEIEPIVAAFEGKPDGFEFKHPLELSFTPTREIPAEAIFHCYYFDEDELRWEEYEDANIYMENGVVHVDIDRLNCAHVITYTLPYSSPDDDDISPIQIEEDRIYNSDVIGDFIVVSNCDCSKVKVVNKTFEKTGVMETLRIDKKLDQKTLEILLNDLRRQLCIPAKTTETLKYREYINDQYLSGLELHAELEVPLTGYTVQQCECIALAPIDKLRTIKGTYKDCEFEYTAVISTCVKKVDELPCPVTSPCHQGCPE